MDSYKYVRAWIDNKGSLDTQVSQVLKKATSSVYLCKSKCRSILFRCPPKLCDTLFKAYVIPHFTYASEVLPYTVKHVQSMNKIIISFARWANGG